MNFGIILRCEYVIMTSYFEYYVVPFCYWRHFQMFFFTTNLFDLSQCSRSALPRQMSSLLRRTFYLPLLHLHHENSQRNHVVHGLQLQEFFEVVNLTSFCNLNANILLVAIAVISKEGESSLVKIILEWDDILLICWTLLA